MPRGIYPHRVKRHAVTQPLDQSYRLIALTQGQNAIVDTTDFEWLNQWNWSALWIPSSRGFYAVRLSTKIYMHRIILGCKSKELADHKNGNTLDNRRENLRKCTLAENNRNRKKNYSSTSKYKGVYEVGKRWQARIEVRGEKKYLGTYETSERAALAYDNAAKMFHREFALLNFPPE